MSKFTAGKWEADVLYGDHYAVFANDHIVADCFGSESNALLVSAAPEMYELIKDAMRMCKGHEVYASLLSRAQKLIHRIDGKEGAEDE